MTLSWLFLPNHTKVIFTLPSPNAPRINAPKPGPALAQARHHLSLPGASMKSVVLPLTWFVVLTCVVALASGLSLSLV
jgi:hypothetical protein